MLPGSTEETVDAFNKLCTAMARLLPATDPGITTRDETINAHITVRVYYPPYPCEFLPLVLFAHGGGFTAGNLDTEDHTCRVVCAEADCIVVSVAYRTGPRITLPTPIDDYQDAYDWVIQNADALGADTTSIVLLGGSTGGALAIALAYRLVRLGQVPAGLAVVQPMSLHPDACPAEYQSQHTSYQDNGAENVPVVNTRSVMAAFQRSSGLPPYPDWTWFPQSGGADALQHFPPTYIFNTDLECSRDDGGVLEAELRDALVPVKRDMMTGFPHYFWVFPVTNGGAQFRDRLVNGIRWLIHQAELAKGLGTRHI